MQLSDDVGADRAGKGAHRGRGCRGEKGKEVRDAKLRHSQEEKAEVEERHARDLARHQRKASGGTEAAFD